MLIFSKIKIFCLNSDCYSKISESPKLMKAIKLLFKLKNFTNIKIEDENIDENPWIKEIILNSNQLKSLDLTHIGDMNSLIENLEKPEIKQRFAKLEDLKVYYFYNNDSFSNCLKLAKCFENLKKLEIQSKKSYDKNLFQEIANLKIEHLSMTLHSLKKMKIVILKSTL